MVVLAPISTSSPPTPRPAAGSCPRPLPQRRVRREAETVRAQHHATVDDGARADLDALVQRDVGMQAAVGTDRRSGANHAACAQHAAAADPRSRLDNAIRTDTHVVFDVRVSRDHRRGVRGGRQGRTPRGVEPLRHPGVQQIGMLAHDQRETRPVGAGGLQRLGHVGRDDHRPRLGGGKLALVFGIGQEADFLAAGRRQRADAADPQGIGAGRHADAPVHALGIGGAQQRFKRRRAGKIQ